MSSRGIARAREISSEHVTIGHDILGLISSAMYVEPLTIYREIIQNAADAIDEAYAAGVLSPGQGRVDIVVDPLHRQLRARDNGVGVRNADFIKTMCAIGSSPKRGEKARGFRGIGRLVGLGYAQELVFRSRSAHDERVMEATWDCRLLKESLRSRFRAPLADVVAEVVAISERVATANEPAHFFEIELRRVVRLAEDGLLNANTVERYVAAVAPVPFSPDFSLGQDIARRLTERRCYPVIGVYVNGSATPVTRPYRDAVALSPSKTANLSTYELFEIPAHDGDQIAAVAWVAAHEYLGAFPRHTGVRGLRARIGNLQIGDEHVFAAAFSEERFTDWCVGEVHILDERIVPNGRRDDFEPNLHFANLINHLANIGRDVARVARTSSVQRRAVRGLAAVEAALRDYRKLLEVSPEAYILREELIADVRSEIDRARKRLVAAADRKRLETQLAKIERQAEAARKATPPSRVRIGDRERGRADVLRLLRAQIPGGLSVSTALLKLLADRRKTRRRS
jgi:histidine kinase/DNA gyrase B/HSP90-like ATPase